MKRKIIAVTCALAVVITSLFAIGIFQNSSTTKVKSARSGDELTAEEVKTAVLPEEDVPLGMSYDEAVAEGHRVRLYDQEPNDYTVIFQNEDDTRTMYYYNVPVKHTDTDGTTFDIDVSVEKSKDKKYKYANTQNSVKLGFPKKVENGIDISGDRDVSVKPVYEHTEKEEQTAGIVAPKGALFVTAASSVVRYLSTVSSDETEATATEEYVDYPNAFGPDTTLRCTPVVNGVKQDVILDKNIGENTFAFDFNFGNQEVIEEEDGTLSVYDNETEEVTGFITPIKVFDAEGTEAEDCYYTYDKTESGEWRITANVNEEFLNSEDTVYPVTVDPDYIDTPAYGVKDAMVNKTATTKNYGSATSFYVGQYSSGSIMRVLIAFTQLNLTAIDQSQIVTSKFSVKDLVQNDAALTIQAYEYLKAWDESTVTWNSSGVGSASNYGSSVVDSQVISKSAGADNSYPHRYYFDIKSVAKKWCCMTSNPTYGFMLKSSSETTARFCTFGSSNATSNKPTLIFRYYPAAQTVANGPYYLKSPSTGKMMTRASDSTHAHNVRQNALLDPSTNSQNWKIEYYADGYYYIHEYNNSSRNLKVEYIENSTNVRTAEANAGSEYQLFRIIKSKYGYRLIPKKYLTRCVQLNAASASENINVVTAVYSGLNHQEWYLIDAPKSVVVSPESATLVVDQTKQLSATVYPTTASQNVTWTSSNTNVATVSAAGLVTAKAAGTATITATAIGFSDAKDTCTIIVLNKPDLTVSALSCPNGVVGQPLDISATVKNVNSTAPASTLGISITDGTTGTRPVESLAAGATSTKKYTWTPTAAGTYTITATADYTDAVDEANENNNTKTITVIVMDLPDLKSPTSIIIGNYAGEDIRISSGIENRSTLATAPASVFNISISDDDGEVVFTDDFDVPELSAGGNFDVETVWVPEKAGSFTITYTVDAENAIIESDETNNTRTQTVTYEYDDVSEPTNDTMEGAVELDLYTSVDNEFGSKSSKSSVYNKIFMPGDVDYFKVEKENMIMLQVKATADVEFRVLDEDGKTLGEFSGANTYYKVKTTSDVCYVEVTSETRGGYFVNVTAFAEK